MSDESKRHSEAQGTRMEYLNVENERDSQRNILISRSDFRAAKTHEKEQKHGVSDGGGRGEREAV